jgi:hypothetical protein
MAQRRLSADKFRSRGQFIRPKNKPRATPGLQNSIRGQNIDQSDYLKGCAEVATDGAVPGGIEIVK